MKALLLAAVLASGCATVQAATVCTMSPCHVRSVKAFSVAANHGGANTIGYRLYLNGSVVGTKPVSALQNGSIVFSFPSINRGTYMAIVVAYNAQGESVVNPSIIIIATPNGS